MVFSFQNKHKKTTIKINHFPEMHHMLQNAKFSVFTLQCTNVRENYGNKIVHGISKAKRINVGEAKVGEIFSKINSQALRKSQNVPSCSLNPKFYKYFGHKVYYNQNEKLGMFGVIHVCARDGEIW